LAFWSRKDVNEDEMEAVCFLSEWNTFVFEYPLDLSISLKGGEETN